MDSLIQKLKPYTLLIAISMGFIGFLCFHYIKALEPLKPLAHSASDNIHLVLFFILFFAFCRVDFHQMKPKTWHYIMVIIQFMVSYAFALVIVHSTNAYLNTIMAGLLVCCITPTAASASVITGKLGGNEASLTAYIIISNFLAAIALPFIFPMISTQVHSSFLEQSLTVLSKVSPILIFPLIMALFLRTFMKKAHRFVVVHTKDAGYYLWALIIMFMSAKTFSSIYASEYGQRELIVMSALSLLLTIVNFSFGKGIGHCYGQRISGGQAFGQKNMAFGMWAALAYLPPSVAIIPGTYIIWQNMVNAWQIWYRERNLARWEREGIPPYQE